MTLKEFNNIEKSPNDKRKYRGLELKNHLKVILISDEETDKSAAALTVAIGSLSNPKELQGLAHFCEHMLFLGTEKYPVENTYTKFISEHGGSFNAATGFDQTYYYFDIATNSLAEGLDIFAQFFIGPLFTESATEREVNAVNSEHQKNIPEDNWRQEQLDQHLAKSDHPYNSFSTGNLDTLWHQPKKNGLDIREELLKFHEKWYSSNIMTLAVLGKENLDDLQKMVVNLFQDIKNKEVQAPKWDVHPFGEEQFQTCVYMTPIKDTRELVINFPFEDVTEHYRSKPAHYLTQLIGHEGPGSILSYLKFKNWATALNAGDVGHARGIAIFQINIILTKEGLSYVDEIIRKIFQYINLIKSVPPQKWVHDEIKDIKEIGFRFQEYMDPIRYVLELSNKLLEHPIEDVLTCEDLITEWNPEIIDRLLKYLDPHNIRVKIIAKELYFDLNQTEPYYGTRYKLIRIPKSTIEGWINAGLSPEFKFPKENAFIPKNFDLLPLEEVKKHPFIIKENALTRVWFKQDDTYYVPKAVTIVRIKNPLANLDPLNSVLTRLFIDLFSNYFKEFAYDAELANLFWSISGDEGIEIYITGYNDKLDVFLEKLIKELIHFKIDPGQFRIFKQIYLEELNNIEYDSMYTQVWHGLRDCLYERFWNPSDYLKVFDDATMDQLIKFIPQLFSKIHIEALVHGNVNKNKAIAMIQVVEDQLKSNFDTHPVFPQLLLPRREVRLENRYSYIYEINNKAHKDNCITVYYQCGLESTPDIVKIELVEQILKEPSFSILRTKEQLAYIIYSFVEKSNSVNGLLIHIQSNRHPEYLDQRIEEFMKVMEKFIKNIPEEDFNRHREALAVQKLEKPKYLSAHTNIYAAEINNQHYHFDRDNVEVAYLRSLSKFDIIEFYEKKLAADAPERKKLSIYGYGTEIKSLEGDQDFGNKKFFSEDQKNTKRIFIRNAVDFKRTHGYYPLAMPYVDINTLKN